MGSVLVIGQVGEGTRDQLGGSLREELASMREQLDSLAQKIMELVEWQKEVGREMTKKAEENGKVVVWFQPIWTIWWKEVRIRA